MSFNGGSKSKKEALEVAVDVSKALAYVDPRKVTWQSMLKWVLLCCLLSFDEPVVFLQGRKIKELHHPAGEGWLWAKCNQYQDRSSVIIAVKLHLAGEANEEWKSKQDPRENECLEKAFAEQKFSSRVEKAITDKLDQDPAR